MAGRICLLKFLPVLLVFCTCSPSILRTFLDIHQEAQNHFDDLCDDDGFCFTSSHLGYQELVEELLDETDILPEVLLLATYELNHHLLPLSE